jgi:hypothetical protein
MKTLSLLIAACLIPATGSCAGQLQSSVTETVVGSGWANNSVNVVVFRKNSLATDRDTQYVAYYDEHRYVVLGKRKLGATTWETHRTQYQGQAGDAHDAISLMVDGAGVLHVAWDHHNNKLHYAQGVRAGALELGPQLPMVSRDEDAVTYPEFYRIPDGKLLFFYRTGKSGQGNLVVNRYDLASRHWERLQDNLIDGEGKRSAYWQSFVDRQGTIHISWVWRESPDVASNHDMAYARSRDGGHTWETSAGVRYTLPITAATAEYAARIPQRSELINQTSMSADSEGRPYIASYWRDRSAAVPQYHLLFRTGEGWRVRSLDFRHTPFSLSGAGTKRIPISRPQLLVDGTASTPSGLLVFRDEERGNRVSVATFSDVRNGDWTLRDLSTGSVGSWEPTYDTELWKRSGILSLFVQDAVQVDGEGRAAIPVQAVRVMDWKPGP